MNKKLRSLTIMVTSGNYPFIGSPVILLVGTACIYSIWNSFCNYDVLGFESGKSEKGQRYSDLQRDCSLF